VFDVVPEEFLASPSRMDKLAGVNAAEIIDQIKQLPPQEKGKVAEFVRADTLRHASDEEARRAADAVFTEHPELFRQLAR
jgi:hypothetical protein